MLIEGAGVEAYRIHIGAAFFYKNISYEKITSHNPLRCTFHGMP